MTEENGQEDVASEPTNDQLANFACVLIIGPGFGSSQQQTVKAMFEEYPTLRKNWLRYHSDFQEGADRLAADLIKETNEPRDQM